MTGFDYRTHDEEFQDRAAQIKAEVEEARQRKAAREAARTEAIAKRVAAREVEEAVFRKEAAAAARRDINKKAEMEARAELDVARVRLQQWANERGLAPTEQNAQAIIMYLLPRHNFTEAGVDAAIAALAQQLEWISPLLRRQ